MKYYFALGMIMLLILTACSTDEQGEELCADADNLDECCQDYLNSDVQVECMGEWKYDEGCVFECDISDDDAEEQVATDYAYCENDDDCACGMIETRAECGFANIDYLVAQETCQLECFGDTGAKEARCVDNTCVSS